MLFYFSNHILRNMNLHRNPQSKDKHRSSALTLKFQKVKLTTLIREWHVFGKKLDDSEEQRAIIRDVPRFVNRRSIVSHGRDCRVENFTEA